MRWLVIKRVNRLAYGIGSKEVILMEINGFNLPDELYYIENHFWLLAEMKKYAEELKG